MKVLRVSDSSRRRMRGSSLIELIAVLTILGIVLSVTAGQFLSTQREAIDQVGPVLVSAAVLDARAVASANHYRYPSKADELAEAMNAVSSGAQDSGMSATFVPRPAAVLAAAAGKGTVEVSVAAGSPTTIGFAALTSSDGPQDGSCTLAVDSLRTGTRFAQVTGIDVEKGGCSAAVAIACSETWKTGSAPGSAAQPYSLSPGDACIADAR